MLKKALLFLLLSLFTAVNYAQDFSALWEGHFSYLNIKDIAQGNDRIYAAAENAIFTYDLTTQEIETISTINGLSGEIISTIHYSSEFGLLIIGYENGLVEIVFDTDLDVLTVVDILEKETIPPDNKRINHFNEHEGYVYISTDFGISVYDLSRLEFGDTYFIGTDGGQKVITQTAVFNDFLYSSSFTGIQKAELNNPNIIDYSEWLTINGSYWLGVEAVDGKLFATRSTRMLYEIVNDSFTSLFTYTNLPIDLKSVGNYLIVTTSNEINVYDSGASVLGTATINANFNTEFTSGIVDDELNFYIGTKNFGVLSPSLENELGFDEIHPDGPLLNNAFSVEAYPDNLWVTFGDYTFTYNPGPVRRRGISHLVNAEWINKPFDSLLGARNLNSIAINPNNQDQLFISSFIDGILEVNNDTATVLFDQTNSGLESLILPNNPGFMQVRVSGSEFDENGVLWSITSLVDRALKSYNPSSGAWQGYSFSDLLPDPFDTLGFGPLVIDNFGNKWVGSFSFGVIGYNENGNLIKNITEDEGSLPINNVRSLAVDNRNNLWIGTEKGLRVLFNTSNFFNDENVETQSIIILEDGVPKELLFQQFITEIEVDGSNNKWIGTLTSGIFYFSQDGQETIFHFTKDNSPLPSNSINDISLDEDNGIVYIATDQGLVSFKSGGSTPKEGLSEAFAYPNPVRPNFNIVDEKVKIKDVSENVNIKITDIEGNLVAEAQSRTNSRYKGFNLEIDGGTAYWNGKNLANNVVASGVYLVMLSDLETFENKVLKLMIIR
ncbi:MAG: ABC transporter substrate-binding protein [Flavobacteriaceae bacterium]|nr:ABC transporter substrate-binding protein [Flavobacteriaceae bacterium]NNK28373.1 ABC transporter substrate-binding protein [Flavobacteriaceae bacterium]